MVLPLDGGNGVKDTAKYGGQHGADTGANV